MVINPFQSVGVARRTIESVMMLVSFAMRRWMDALIYLTIAIPER
jgi:hypothetical protein